MVIIHMFGSEKNIRTSKIIVFALIGVTLAIYLIGQVGVYYGLWGNPLAL